MIFDRPLKLTDFKTKELIGTTHGTANTARKFKHGTEQVPAYWIAVEGNVYVPRNGLGPNEIDVRSTATSEEFRILLFF